MGLIYAEIELANPRNSDLEPISVHPDSPDMPRAILM